MSDYVNVWSRYPDPDPDLAEPPDAAEPDPWEPLVGRSVDVTVRGKLQRTGGFYWLKMGDQRSLEIVRADRVEPVDLPLPDEPPVGSVVDDLLGFVWLRTSGGWVTPASTAARRTWEEVCATAAGVATGARTLRTGWPE